MQPETLQKIDALIREGHADRARRELGDLRRRRIPRERALMVASLARRAGMPALGLRVLNPIVRPSAKSPVRATAAEKAEYAASLLRVGAGSEALRILTPLDKSKNPEVLLFEAMAHFTKWDYSTAIPILRRYLDSASLPPYQRLVGKVNLAAALLYEREYSAADKTLREIREETKTRNFHLLFGNSLELSAQLAIFQKKFPDAEKFLAEAQQALKHSGGLDELFVRKWKAIAKLLQRRGKAAPGELNDLREEARKRRHWETLRDCDLFEAIARVDGKILTHLHFGTPYESYRRRIFLEFGHPLEIPKSYVWNVPVTRPSKRKPKEIDFSLVKQGQQFHRLLTALTSDFYRPQRVASLHADIYPDEFFNPVSSPMRIHQAIRRLRRWFSAAGLPIAVKEVDGSYSLVATSPCRIRISREEPPADLSDFRWRRLKERFAGKNFSASEAARALATSDRTAVRFLLAAVEDGKIERLGSSSATRYRICL